VEVAIRAIFKEEALIKLNKEQEQPLPYKPRTLEEQEQELKNIKANLKD
jgi:hypothetical protein